MSLDEGTIAKTVVSDREVHNNAQLQGQVHLLAQRNSPEGQETDPVFEEERPSSSSDTVISERPYPRRLATNQRHFSQSTTTHPQISRSTPTNRGQTPVGRRGTSVNRGLIPVRRGGTSVNQGTGSARRPMMSSSGGRRLPSVTSSGHSNGLGSFLSLHEDHPPPSGMHQCLTAPGSLQALSTVPFKRRVAVNCPPQPEDLEILIKDAIVAMAGERHEYTKYIRSQYDSNMLIITLETLDSKKSVGDIITELSSKMGRSDVLFLPLGPELDCSNFHVPFYLQCGEQPPDVGTDTARDTAPTNDHSHLHMSQLCSLHNYFDDHSIYGVRFSYVEERKRVVFVLPREEYENLTRLGWQMNSPTPVTVLYKGEKLTMHRMQPVDWSIVPDGPLEPNVVVASRLPDKFKAADLEKYFCEAVNGNGRIHVEVTTWKRCRALVRFLFDGTEATEQSFDAVYHKLLELICQKHFNGHMIAIQKVPESLQLLLAAKSPDCLVENDRVRLKCHLSARAVEKGCLKEVDLVQIEFKDGNAFAKFRKREALLAVLDNNKSREFYARELQIAPYFDVIDDSNQP